VLTTGVPTAGWWLLPNQLYHSRYNCQMSHDIVTAGCEDATTRSDQGSPVVMLQENRLTQASRFSISDRIAYH
jgi:hypothetical protein